VYRQSQPRILAKSIPERSRWLTGVRLTHRRLPLPGR
jgi:hypothetical protein